MDEIVEKKVCEQVLGNRLAVFSVFLILSGSLVFVPTWWDPYVRVRGSTVALQLHCVPSDLHLRPRSDYVHVRRSELVVRDLSGKREVGRFPMDVHGSPVGRVIHLGLVQSNQQKARTYLAGLDQEDRDIFAVIEFSRVPNLSLDSVVNAD